MGAFGGFILTNKGRNLQTKAQTGVQLQFSRIAIGDGSLGGSSILDLNALISEKKSLSITTLKVLTGGQATVGANLSNQDITTGFYLREIGVFANDPTEGEILYCYANSGSTADYIPAGGGPDIVEKTINVITLVGNASNISAVIDQSLIYYTKPASGIPKTDLESAVQTSLNKADTALQSVPAASTSQAGIVQLTDSVSSTSTTTAATPNSVKEVNDSLATHKADYVKHPGYGVTTNSGNAYAVTLSPAPDAYVDGMTIRVKLNADSTSPSTINVNSLGAIPLKSSTGDDAAGLKTNGIYTFVYNLTTGNFILQGEGVDVATLSSSINAIYDK